jgi:hypothetical protein
MTVVTELFPPQIRIYMVSHQDHVLCPGWNQRSLQVADNGKGKSLALGGDDIRGKNRLMEGFGYIWGLHYSPVSGEI